MAIDRAKAELANAESMAHAAQVDVPITTTTACNVTSAQGGVEQARGGMIAAEKESAGHTVGDGEGPCLPLACHGATGVRFSLLPADSATGHYVKVVQRVPVKNNGEDPGHLLQPGISALPTIYTR